MSEKKYKLPKQFTEKWFPALLSDKYKQAFGLLYDTEADGYCCLGVAGVVCGISNDILEDRTMVEKFDKQDVEDTLVLNGILGKRRELYVAAVEKGYPDELMDTTICMDGCLGDKLADLNDGGSTFAEIVDWIKENVELYDEPNTALIDVQIDSV